MCYSFNEVNGEFQPLALNSKIKLVKVSDLVNMELSLDSSSTNSSNSSNSTMKLLIDMIIEMEPADSKDFESMAILRRDMSSAVEIEKETVRERGGKVNMRSAILINVKKWTTQDVTKFVQGLTGIFGDKALVYGKTMLQEDISGEVLVVLQEQDLKNLGFSLGHRKIFMTNITPLFDAAS